LYAAATSTLVSSTTRLTAAIGTPTGRTTTPLSPPGPRRHLTARRSMRSTSSGPKGLTGSSVAGTA
jgi:hypothetical protein